MFISQNQGKLINYHFSVISHLLYTCTLCLIIFFDVWHTNLIDMTVKFSIKYPVFQSFFRFNYFLFQTLHTLKKPLKEPLVAKNPWNFFFHFTVKKTTIFVRIFCGGVFTKNIDTSPMFSDPRASPFRGCRGWNRGNLAPRKCSLSEAVARPNRSQNAALQRASERS